MDDCKKNIRYFFVHIVEKIVKLAQKTSKSNVFQHSPTFMDEFVRNRGKMIHNFV